MYKLTILILLCFLLSCGSIDSPTSSNSDLLNSNTAITDPMTLNIISGLTGTPVNGATVIVNNNSYTTNEKGYVTVQSPPEDSTPIEIVAEGFLTRKTYLLANSDRTFDLLPKTTPSGVDIGTIQSMLYSFGPAYPESTSDVIHRVEDTHISFVLSEDILKNSKAMSAHEFAVEQLNEVTAGEITASIETEETVHGFVVQVRIDPEDEYFKENPEASAVTRLNGSFYAIEKAEIVYAGSNKISAPEYNRQLVVHEFGHLFLNHSLNQDDVMGDADFFGLLGKPETFSQRETDIIRYYLLQRKSGNAWEDNDRAVEP